VSNLLLIFGFRERIGRKGASSVAQASSAAKNLLNGRATVLNTAVQPFERLDLVYTINYLQHGRQVGCSCRHRRSRCYRLLLCLLFRFQFPTTPPKPIRSSRNISKLSPPLLLAKRPNQSASSSANSAPKAPGPSSPAPPMELARNSPSSSPTPATTSSSSPAPPPNSQPSPPTYP
jgi:hypothetical protein